MMNDVILYPTWAGPEARAPIPTPSWMAPPLPDLRLETHEMPPLRVSLHPSESALLHASLHPTFESRAPLAFVPPSVPPPPEYPDLRGDVAALEAQLAAAADAITQLRRRVLEASESQLVGLACAIGERIAGRELTTDPEIVIGWAREAIERLANDGSLVVAVSPDIAAVLDGAAWTPMSSASVRIETDPSLRAASCEVRAPSSSVDASLAGRTEAVRREVLGAAA